MRRLLLALLFGLVAVPASATTYYVTTGTDPTDSTGAGTSGSPWNSLYYTLMNRAFAAGDRIILKAGTYRVATAGFASSCEYDGSNCSVMPIKLAGTAGNPITITNEPGGVVIIDGTSTIVNTGTAWTSCGSGAYQIAAWKTTGTRTGQIWDTPANAHSAGTRFKWNATTTCTSVGVGEMGIGAGGTGLFIHLTGGADPNTHTFVVSCEGGDCAYNPVTFFTGATYVTLKADSTSGGELSVWGGRQALMVESGASHLEIVGTSYTDDGAWTAGELFLGMCGTRDYGSCMRVYDGSFVHMQYFYATDAMGENIQPYGGGPVTGIDISNVTIEDGEAYRSGLAWSDNGDGGNGNNLGFAVIIKNCSTCTLRHVHLGTCYASAIEVTTSTSTGTTDGVTIDRVTLSDFGYLNVGCTGCGGRTLAGIQIEPQRSAAGGAVKNVTVTNTYVFGGHFGDGTTFPAADAPSTAEIDGLHLSDAGNTAMTGIVIANNSFKNLQGPGFNVAEQSVSFTFRNNIFDTLSTGGNTCNGAARCDVYLPTTAYTHTNNTYWATNSTDVVIYISGGTTHTRSAVVGSFEATAIQSDPLLVSSTNLDLQAGSPMIDVGTNTNCPAVDHANTARPINTICDIGGFEYGAATTPAVPTNLRVVVGPPVQLRWNEPTAATVTGFRICLDGLTGTACTDVGLPTGAVVADTPSGYLTYTIAFPSMAPGRHALTAEAYNGANLSTPSISPLVVTVSYQDDHALEDP